MEDKVVASKFLEQEFGELEKKFEEIQLRLSTAEGILRAIAVRESTNPDAVYAIKLARNYLRDVRHQREAKEAGLRG